MVLVPWWIALVASVYCLLQLGLTASHPCTVLGIASPVTRARVSRAYRELSLCTHPDKQPNAEAAYRGGLLFNRASAARDNLVDLLREASSSANADDENEAAAAAASCATGLNLFLLDEFVGLFVDMPRVWFHRAVAASAALLGRSPDQLLASPLLSPAAIAGALALILLSYLARPNRPGLRAQLASIASLLGSLLLGPLPTVLRFVRLPGFRAWAFVSTDLLPFLTPPTPAAEGAEAAGGAEAAAGGGTAAPVDTLPLFALLARTASPQARLAASASLQFEVLLSLTKNFIPLLVLMATGRHLNGVWTSLLAGQLLRRIGIVPPELLHLLLVAAGALHTVLAASDAALQGTATADGGAAGALLQLQWVESSRDVMTVASIALLGASFAAASGSGNEPPFCASFASGVAIRMALYDVMAPSDGGATIVSQALGTASSGFASLLRAACRVEFVGADAVAVRCGGLVGTCGGGPLRAALAWVQQSAAEDGETPIRPEAVPGMLVVLAVVLKGALLFLPVLSLAQWGVRIGRLMRTIEAEPPAAARVGGVAAAPAPATGAGDGGGGSGGGGDSTDADSATSAGRLAAMQERLLLSICVLVCTGRMVAFVLFYELNGVNSSLGGFLLVALAGCLFESLLATFDVGASGPMRRVCSFVLFALQ